MPGLCRESENRAAGAEKQRTDELEYAQLLEDNVPAAPIYNGLDGGMNKVFLARFPGRVTFSSALPYALTCRNCSPILWVDNDGSLTSKLFGTLFDRHGRCGTLRRAEGRYHGWQVFLAGFQLADPGTHASYQDVRTTEFEFVINLNTAKAFGVSFLLSSSQSPTR